MKKIKWAALVFAILLILNACGSHETQAPAEPSEPSETLETTETTEDTEEPQNLQNPHNPQNPQAVRVEMLLLRLRMQHLSLTLRQILMQTFQSLPLQKKAVIPLYISRRISLRRDWSESMNPLAGTRRENRPLRSLQVSRRQAIICGLS